MLVWRPTIIKSTRAGRWPKPIEPRLSPLGNKTEKAPTTQAAASAFLPPHTAVVDSDLLASPGAFLQFPAPKPAEVVHLAWRKPDLSTKLLGIVLALVATWKLFPSCVAGLHHRHSARPHPSHPSPFLFTGNFWETSDHKTRLRSPLRELGLHPH